jgi:hypothetical protein
MRMSALVLAFGFLSCSRERPQAPDRPKAEADSKADMPGMRMEDTSAATAGDSGAAPGMGYLTAAQVRHGHVRWAPVETGTTGESGSVPGQVVPDEPLGWVLPQAAELWPFESRRAIALAQARCL